MIGIVNFLKPTGMTSSDAVVKIRGILKERKVGHLGTLDPLACGVLPIAVGKATRLFDVFLTKDKLYRAYFDFSKTTDTLDSDGIVTNASKKAITKEEIERVLPKFIGEIQQMPPKYSAKSINGKRAYELARDNIEVELKPSKINIYDIKLIEKYSNNIFVFDIHCSSGTYIRSIVRDIAEELGVYGFMPALIRLSAGNFTIENSVTSDDLVEKGEKAIILPENAIDFLPELKVLDKIQSKKLSHGIKQEINREDGMYRLYFDEEFIGIGEVQNKKLRIKLNFTV